MGELVGGALVLRQEAFRGKTWLWCPGGPLLPEEDSFAVWAVLRRAIQEKASLVGDLFLRMEPLVPTEKPLLQLGRVSTESYLPRHTLLLDLTLSETALLEQMKQKGRYNIRQAEKRGVCVEAAGMKGLDVFYDLLLETAQRDGFHVHEKSFYRAFMEVLGESAQLYLAKVGSKVIGGFLGTQFGKTATYYFGASSNENREDFAPYALQWHAIQAAKHAGCTRYDFLGIAPEGSKTDALVGVTQFKTRFGGERMDYQSAQKIVYRPVWNALYALAKCARRLRPF